MTISDKARIYLISRPRAGSTWLAGRLAAHPRVLQRHEPDIARRSPLPYLLSEAPDNNQIEAFAAYLDQCASLNLVRATARPAYDVKDFRGGIGDALWFGLAYAAKGLAHYVPALSTRLPIADLIWRPDKLDAVLIKSVTMLGRAALLRACLRPQDRVVFLLREPLASVASLLDGARRGAMQAPIAHNDWHQLPLARAQGWSATDMQKFTPAQIAAVGWAGFNDVALSAFKDDQRVLVLRHSDLVRRDPSKLAAISQHVDIDIDFGAVPTSTGPAPDYFSTEKSTEAVLNNWQQILTDREIAEVKEICAGSNAARLFA